MIVGATARGEVYYFNHDFGQDFAAAARVVERIAAAGGRVSEDRWTFARNVYGSEAYVASNEEAGWAARERADYEAGIAA
jgi:hypothetical protein